MRHARLGGSVRAKVETTALVITHGTIEKVSRPIGTPSRSLPGCWHRGTAATHSASRSSGLTYRGKMGWNDPGVVDWLLAGDPSIHWQVLEGLLNAPAAEVEAERARVAREGWGAQLLTHQDPEGTWAQGLYSPKWVSTTYTMLLLRDLGLPADHPQAHRACGVMLDAAVGPRSRGGVGWASETCIAGLVLSILSAFKVDDDRLERFADYLLNEQMIDGGWNCQYRRGAHHASMNTTILALEALVRYERHRARQARRLIAVREAQRRGRDFLLVHHLYRSHRSGKVIQRNYVRFAFPPQWHFDVLRGLDYFRDAAAPRDTRLLDGIDLLRSRQDADGRWTLEHRYQAREWFEMETVGRSSRWNTLRALRVLAWWDDDPTT